jgi:hypothetical protein
LPDRFAQSLSEFAPLFFRHFGPVFPSIKRTFPHPHRQSSGTDKLARHLHDALALPDLVIHPTDADRSCHRFSTPRMKRTIMTGLRRRGSAFGSRTIRKSSLPNWQIHT